MTETLFLDLLRAITRKLTNLNDRVAKLEALGDALGDSRDAISTELISLLATLGEPNQKEP